MADKDEDEDKDIEREPEEDEEEEERAPEALRAFQDDLSGNHDNRRWRYAVRDVDALDFAGPGVWKQVGPAPLLVGGNQIYQGLGPDSGEVVDIAIDPRGGPDRTIYIAAGSGGVWKSTDDGVTWRPLTDHLPSTAIGAIAIDPGDADIVYVGTGNLYEGSAGMPKAAGLFKSLDGGRTFARIGVSTGRPPQLITVAATVPGLGVQITVPAHGFANGDRVAAVGLPGLVGSGAEIAVQVVDANQLMLPGLSMTAAFVPGPNKKLYDARQPPFLSDRGVVRMVCPAPNTLLVATESGLYLSMDGGRGFGANHPAYDDGRPIKPGLITALEIDQQWMRTVRVTDTTIGNPIVVKAVAHGFKNGDRVFIGGVEPNHAVNNGWIVDFVDVDHFSLRGSNGAGATAGATSGYAIGPARPVTRNVESTTNATPIVVKATAHGLLTGDVVAISGVQGNTAANRSWAITVLTPDTFSLDGSVGNAAGVANTGTIDGPAHGAARAVTQATNAGANLTLKATAHGLRVGDRVTVTGLPGIAAPNNWAAVTAVADPDHVTLAGLQITGAYGGAGATVSTPADSWNTVYFASAGREHETNNLNPARGLYRLAITSTGQVVLSDDLLAHTGGPPPAYGRVSFAQSLLPDARRLYVSIQDNEFSGVFVGLFRSDDLGATWTAEPALLANATLDGTGQSYYNLTLGVDPQQGDVVYAGFQQLWRSLDAGHTWPAVVPVTKGGVDGLPAGQSPSTTLLHWDHHELTFAPATRWPAPPAAPALPATPVYLGTDGGIARGETPGGVRGAVMRFAHLNEGVATSLIRDLDIGRGAGNKATFAGMQDTGTAGHRVGDGGTAWTEGIDGDGGDVAVDPANPEIVFAFTNSSLIRTTNGGRTWFSSSPTATAQIVNVVHNEPLVRVVTTGHPFATGDQVTIGNVPGGPPPGASGANQMITVLNATDFTLDGHAGAAGAPVFGPFPTVTGPRFLTEATIKSASAAKPIVIETTAPHGCVNGNRVRIDGVEGIAANNSDARPTWTVTKLSATQLQLTGSDGTTGSYVPGTGRLRGPQVNGSVPIHRAENATPIVVTARGHGFVSGDQVTVANVTGIPNAPARTIRVLDANSFELVGTAGAGVVVARPFATGPSIGRNLVPAGQRRHVALVPNGAAPATTVFVSSDARLFRSIDGGITFGLVSTMTDDITALHAPAAGRLWVGTAGNVGAGRPGKVFLSTDNGANYVLGNFDRDVGARGAIAAIAEDPQNPLQVAVVASGYSQTATPRRTRHCFVTTTGGMRAGATAGWKEVGGTFDAGKGNLPDVPLMSVAWDNSVKAAAGAPPVPSTLLVASDSGVLRLGAGGKWERVGPNLPNVSCQALAVDNSATPNIIRVGTYGRSAWEFTPVTGPSLYVEADLGFGDLQVGATAHRRIVLHSVGDAPVTVATVSLPADAQMTLAAIPGDPALQFPLVLASGARRAIDVVFAPTTPGVHGGPLTVTSDDPVPPPAMKASGEGVGAGKPRLSVRGFVEFDTVKSGAPSKLALDLRNIGSAPLTVTKLAPDPAGSNRFSLVAPPATPFVIAPGDTRTITVQFAPTVNGALQGALIVEGGGHGAVVSLSGTGTTTNAGMLALLLNAIGLSSREEALV